MINSFYISYERTERIMKRMRKEAGVIMQREENKELVLPKNIRQMGGFGDTYKIYVEDFVYTYVHQFLHRKKKEDLVLAAVLLGKTVQQEGQEYVFISGAQKVDFQMDSEETEETSPEQAEAMEEETGEMETRNQEMLQAEAGPDVVLSRQQEFWDRVYQRIKQYFDDCEILGWYFNLDGSNLEVNTQLQQFFESTYKKGSRFLYYEDSLEKEDAFFVQEQHRLQRLSGYAVYYEKNPQMQEFMIAEKERMTPKPLRDSYAREERDEVVQNYRAIMNKLNEKPPKKKFQPVIYVAGVAVLAVVAATGVSQIGNYQNLKVLEQTMQTLSGAVDGKSEDVEAPETQEAREDAAEGEKEKTDQNAAETESSAEAEKPASETDTENGSSKGNAQAEEQTPAASSAGENNTGADSADTENADAKAVETENANAETGNSGQQTVSAPQDYYIVKKGDSLVSISRSVYHTSSKVDEICQLNHIENMDMIYEGQKLLLP